MFKQDNFKQSPFKTAKFKSRTGANNDRGHSRSPNHSFSSKSNHNSSSISMHSDNLWSSLDQTQIFPAYYVQLLRHQDRNIKKFKSEITRQKQRVTLQMQALSVQIMHMMEDYKLSLIAILDRIYQNYINKQAEFKSQLLEINRIQDQILMEVNLREGPHHTPLRNQNGSNDYAVKSIQSNTNQLRKFRLMNYITELQKEKAIPLTEIAEYLVILTEYDNGFFQYDQYHQIIAGTKSKFKTQFRQLIQNVYAYIRNPDAIVAKQLASNNRQRNNQGRRRTENPNHILGEINEAEQQQAPTNIRRSNNQQNYPDTAYDKKLPKNPSFRDINPNQNSNNIDPYRIGSDQLINKDRSSSMFHQQHYHQHTQAIVSGSMSRVTADNIKLNPRNTFKSVSSDIMLCCLYITDNLIVLGNKDGSLVFYDQKGNTIKSFAQQHKSSVCSLAVINDGQYLASGSDYPNSQIILWNLNKLEPFCRFREHKAAVTAIACLRDSQHMISGSYDKKLCVYSIHQQKLKYTLPSNKSSVTGIIINSNSTKLISCGLQDKMLNIWQIVRKDVHITNYMQKVQTLFLEQIIENSTMICSLVSSPVHSNLIYIGTKDGRLKIVDIEKGNAVKTINVCNNAVIQMIVYEQEQGYPLIFGWPCKEKCIKVIDCDNGKISNITTKGMLEFSCGVGPKASANRDGSLVIVGSQGQDRQVSILRINKGI